jgi:hypothetical protein
MLIANERSICTSFSSRILICLLVYQVLYTCPPAYAQVQ